MTKRVLNQQKTILSDSNGKRNHFAWEFSLSPNTCCVFPETVAAGQVLLPTAHLVGKMCFSGLVGRAGGEGRSRQGLLKILVTPPSLSLSLHFLWRRGISKKSRLSIAGLPARFLGVVGRTCQKFITRACQRQAAQAREVNLVALVFWSTVAARWRRCGCLAAVSER